MGMAPDELFAQRLHYIGKVERALLLRHTGMKNDLQEKVAKLLAQIYEIAARNGVGDLVGFLNRIGRDGREILVEVPRTARPRSTEGRHDLKKMGNVAGRAHRTAESGSGASPRRRAAENTTLAAFCLDPSLLSVRFPRRHPVNDPCARLRGLPRTGTSSVSRPRR